MAIKKRTPSLDIIDRELRQAAKMLNRIAGKIRDAGLAPKRNVYRIGYALTCIHDIQNEIYNERPDLLPAYLAGLALSSPRSRRRRGFSPVR